MPSQETIDRNTRAVKDALKREGNRRCADCAARGPTVGTKVPVASMPMPARGISCFALKKKKGECETSSNH